MTSLYDGLGVLCHVDDSQVRKGGLTMLITLGASELSSSASELSSSVDLDGDLDVLCHVDDDQVRKGGLTMLITLGAAE